MKARLVATFGVIALCGVCEPRNASANVYGCSTYVDGPAGSALEVLIQPARRDLVQVDWTPPHTGTGPMSLRLAYDVHGTRFALTRASVEGELAPEAYDTEGTGYIVVKPDTQSTWREPLRADRRGLVNPRTGATTLFVTVVVASNRPNYPGEALAHPRRIELMETIGSLQVTALDRAGNLFSDSAYDISNHQDRDRLFQLAYAKVMDGLKTGCRSAESKCECAG